ncbi:MAG: hypothetical protein VYD45_02440, partial [Pseudomonadota bacterium]|nr:hypothetical protein [Pseudomonadota bacterium]
AGLLALASVLGVGEGHLLHRETRWVGSRYFAKSESLFQSFPSTVCIPEMCNLSPKKARHFCMIASQEVNKLSCLGGTLAIGHVSLSATTAITKAPRHRLATRTTP